MPQQLPTVLIEKIINHLPFIPRFMFMISTVDHGQRKYFRRCIIIDMAPEGFQTRLFIRTQSSQSSLGSQDSLNSQSSQSTQSSQSSLTSPNQNIYNKKPRFVESDATLVTTKTWPELIQRRDDFRLEAYLRFEPGGTTRLQFHEELVSIHGRNLHVNMLSDRTVSIIDFKLKNMFLILECQNKAVVQVNFMFDQDPSRHTYIHDEEEMADFHLAAFWMREYWQFGPCSGKPIQVEISKNVTGWGKRRAKRWLQTFTTILKN